MSPVLGIPGNVLVPVVSAVIGAVALWPLRHQLRPVGYALCVFPVGLLAWAVLPLISTVASTVMRWRVVVPGLVGYTALLTTVAWRMGKRGEVVRGRRPDRTWAGVAAIVLTAICASAFYATGWSIYTVDSWSNYAAYGVFIADTGAFTPLIMANRALLLPALHAAVSFLGGSWTFVIYPLFAVETLVLLVYALWSTAFSEIRSAYRALATLAVVTLLASTAPFLYHSVYVHSHMVSAMYLLLSVSCIVTAFKPGVQRAPWLLMAGLAVTGLAISRPDGYAYAFVPYAVFAVAWLLDASPADRTDVLAIFAPPAVAATAIMLVMVAVYGLYETPERLGALPMIGVMIAGPAAAALLWLVGRPARRHGVDVGRLILTLTAVNALALGAAYLVEPTRFVSMGSIWLLNLFTVGGWNHLWWFGVAVLTAAVVWGPRIAQDRWALPVSYAVFQFLALAALVHGLTHPGRLGTGDSLNRVTFHVVPLLFWLASALVASLFHAHRQDEDLPQ